MQIKMFIKKNLFFFPSRLVFRSGPETPKTEAIVEKVEKDVIRTWAYQNVDDLSRAAAKSLEEDRQKAIKDIPQTTEEDIKSINAINERYNEALVKIEVNKDRIQRLYNYAKQRMELLFVQKSISDRYKSPFTIDKADDYQKVLEHQKDLLILQKLGMETNSAAVKADMAALQVDDMINNTRAAIDNFFMNRLDNDEAKLKEARVEKDKAKLEPLLNDLKNERSVLAGFVSGKFEGSIDPKAYFDLAQSVINGIDKLIREKTPPAVAGTPVEGEKKKRG